MSECFSTNIPTVPLIPDPCDGNMKSTSCVIYADAITYLGLPPNSNVTEIIQALVLSLADARARIEILETP